jgi:hypothetical protein
MTRRTRDLFACIRPAAFSALLSVVLLLSSTSLSAQDISGEYQVEVRGTTHYVDREPAERQLSDNTTLKVAQQGDSFKMEFGSFASAMSATTFEGRVGNNQFVAISWSAGRPGEAPIITGEVVGGRLRGRLILPRATTNADLVPGWTEAEFSAVRQQVSQQTVPQTPSSRSLGRKTLQPRRQAPLSSAGSAVQGFSFETAVSNEPQAATSRDQVKFEVVAEPPPGVEIERVELWINGKRVLSTGGRRAVRPYGPFSAGRIPFYLVAYAADGRKATGETQTLRVYPAGDASVTGDVWGRWALVSDVQLLDSEERVVKKVNLTPPGRYRFDHVPEGRFYIYVNDAGNGATIRPAGGDGWVQSDGKGGYTVNFNVE